jgi:exopolysaccharide biosynthesis operon protein EpsL
LKATPPGKPAWIAYALVSVLAAHALLAQADQEDTFNFSVGLTAQHDNNLFRLDDGVNPRPRNGKSSRSDTITTGSLGLNLKKAYSLQQFEARYEHVMNRYATYDYLDNDADNAGAAWRWHLTPRLSGNLTYDRSQALVGFDDYLNIGAKNMRTTTATRFDADWLATGGWHLRGGVDETKSQNSQTFTVDEGNRLVSADLGVRYAFPSANWIEIVSRSGDGTLYRNLNLVSQLDDAYSEKRHEARFYWRTNGVSVLEGTLGEVAREYDHFSSRDYNGGIGSLKWTWTPTGKLGLVLSWKRDLAAYTDNNASYYRLNLYSIAPVWQVSPKVKLSFKYDHNVRDYLGALAQTRFSRNDSIDTARLIAEWLPTRTIVVSGYLTDESRDANLPGFDYSSRVAGASVRMEF